jgi:hypothetical protein
MGVRSAARKIKQTPERVASSVNYRIGRAARIGAIGLSASTVAASVINAISRVRTGGLDIVPTWVDSMHNEFDPLLGSDSPVAQVVALGGEAATAVLDAGNAVAGFGEDLGGVVGGWLGSEGIGEAVGDGAVAVAGVAVTRKMAAGKPIAAPK